MEHLPRCQKQWYRQSIRHLTFNVLLMVVTSERTRSNKYVTRKGVVAIMAAILLIYQSYTTYQSFTTGGIREISTDIILLFLIGSLFTGIATDSVNSRVFNLGFSFGGIVVSAVSYLINAGLVKIISVILFASGFIYYAFIK